MPLQSWIILAWLFVLGAIIGSFLNVVIFRLPNRLSLVRPGSKCTKCGSPIRWHDNVPIFAWLWLRGRCRDCGDPISVRYPLVELAVALMFLTFGYVDWVRPMQRDMRRAMDQAQVNAQEQIAAKSPTDAIADKGPFNPAPNAPPVDVPTPEPEMQQYVWPVAFHLALLCALLAAAIIDADGHRLPRQLITWPAAIGILLAMFWPAVQKFPLFRPQHIAPADTINWYPLATSLAGMLTAVVMRLTIQRFLGMNRPRQMGLWNASLALYAVGAFLGWQAVLVIGGVTIVWSFIREASAARAAFGQFPPTALVFLATLSWCLTENSLT
jgi:prepilin signal peptidase PulO-like enzyme (type II secretory pathway)